MSHRKTLSSLLILILLAAMLAPTALAQSGLGLSGNFYRQQFRLPAGSEIASPDVYVSVANNGIEALTVRITPVSLPGVQIIPEQETLELQAGEKVRVPVAVRVDINAVPGEYDLVVNAEAQAKTDSGGIQVLGGMSQTASLTVVGQSAMVAISAASPGGSAVPATIKLYREAEGQSYEQAVTDDGLIEMAVAPGSYRAVASLADQVMAEETFEVDADENKSVVLAVNTVTIEQFTLTPVRTGDGELSLVQVNGQVSNLLRAFDAATLSLRVTLADANLPEVQVASYAPLQQGAFGSSYSHAPTDGWQEGTYQFQLVLESEGAVQAESAIERLDVTRQEAGGANTTLLIVGGALLVAVIAAVVVVMLRRGKQS